VPELKLPDLLIADLRLPDGNFLTWLSQSEFSKQVTCPFLVVSSMSDLDVLRSCFEEGALDYLTKPFHKPELIVKVENNLKNRTSKPESKSPSAPVIEVLAAENEQENWNKLMRQLTARELRIFSSLYQNAGNPVSKHRLFEDVWGDVKVGKKTLDVHMFNLRRKLRSSSLQIEFRAPDQFVLLRDRVDH